MSDRSTDFSFFSFIVEMLHSLCARVFGEIASVY